jgi:hypothetical protein
MTRLTVDAFIPGGIKPTDHVHHVTSDDTCSRCRKAVPDDQVPLILWFNDAVDMLVYCEDCTGPEAWAAMAPTVPA